METAILQRLNIIRARERKKLLDNTLGILKTNKTFRRNPFPDDFLIKLANLATEIDKDINYSRSLANLNKLSNLLLNLFEKKRHLKSQLTTLINDLTLSGLEASILEIENNLEELTDKINAYLPEQPVSKPLASFLFLNKDVHIIKGMISVIVLNDNGAEHLKNLFESFVKFNTFNNYKIILLDRASTDHSLEIAGSYKNKLPLEIIPLDQKFTNSYLYNLAVDSCKSTFLLFLNNRVTFKDDILTLFYDIFRIGISNGIIGASLSGPSLPGSGEVADYYGSLKFTLDEIAGVVDIPFPTINPGFLVKSGLDSSIRYYRKEGAVFVPPGLSLTCLKPIPVSHTLKTGIEYVQVISGYAMFCSRADFIQIGGFDLNYIDGYEDIDLCLKFAFQLNKTMQLSHDINLQLNTEDIIAEYGTSDVKTNKYNLGTLLNRQGCIIKNKYFIDLIENNQSWTNDTVKKIKESRKLIKLLGPDMAKEPVNMNNINLAEEIVTGYLDVIKNNKLRIAIKTPAFDDERTKLWGDYHFAHSLKNAFISKGFPARVDLHNYWYDHGYMTDDVVIVLRGTKRYHTRGSQINILWNISHPELISGDEYRDYDFVFSASTAYADELKEKYGIQAENLLQCTDPGLFYPDHENVRDEEKTDILFVGNSREVLRKSVEYSLLKGMLAEVYGSRWEQFIPAGMIKGNYIKNEDLRRYYSNCSILLNDHWPDMITSGFISNRIFDALACGAIVLTDRVNGIEKVFGKGIYYYDNADEFEEQIKWIRKNYTEAKQLALENSEDVLKNHTFDLRAEKILEVALKIYTQKTTIEVGTDSRRKSLAGRLIGFLSPKKS